jgi:hypothetical protein
VLAAYLFVSDVPDEPLLFFFANGQAFVGVVGHFSCREEHGGAGPVSAGQRLRAKGRGDVTDDHGVLVEPVEEAVLEAADGSDGVLVAVHHAERVLPAPVQGRVDDVPGETS